MTTPDPKRPMGRPRKDAALTLRDRYWALSLQRAKPEESFASLELMLQPHLRVTRRELSAGNSQPFSLSKVAHGARGLSPDLKTLPPIVKRAEDVLPGSIAAFTSILWSVLVDPAKFAVSTDEFCSVAPEVSGRLRERHFSGSSSNGLDFRKLNLLGIRRLARLRHLDAVGLLLWHSLPAGPPSKRSITAEGYFFNSLRLYCRSDVALQDLMDLLTDLIKQRYPKIVCINSATGAKLFLAPRISGLAVAIRTLVGTHGNGDARRARNVDVRNGSHRNQSEIVTGNMVSSRASQ